MEIKIDAGWPIIIVREYNANFYSVVKMPPSKKYWVDQIAARERSRTDRFIQDLLHEIIDAFPDEDDDINMDGSIVVATDSDEENDASCSVSGIHEKDQTKALDTCSHIDASGLNLDLDDEGKHHFFPFR